MKKILALSILLFSGFTYAEWVEIDSSDSRNFSFYYDAKSIIKRDNLATIKTLKNFKEPQNSVDPNKPYTFLSSSSIQEIDCARNKYRHKEISMWSKEGGNGKLEQTHIYDQNTSWGKWVKTTSIQSIIMNRACTGK